MVRDAVHKRRFCVLEAEGPVERVAAWRGELQQELEDRVRVHFGRGGVQRPTALHVDVLQHPSSDEGDGGRERGGGAGSGSLSWWERTPLSRNSRADLQSTLLAVRSTRDVHRIVLKCLADVYASNAASARGHTFRVIYVGPTLDACKRRVSRDSRIRSTLRHVRPEVRAKRKARGMKIPVACVDASPTDATRAT